ncbi:MAG: IS1634 family transposase [Oscillospiraceae bacterium]|jgi:hypothetical protein|nr:IS1634 family transposase [Oscillospiraceae bacterium]
MIKKDKRTTATGTVKTQIRVVEGYRPMPGAPPKQRTIKDFGILEEQPDREAFMASVEAFNASYKKENVPLRIEAAHTEQMYSENNRRLNYGHRFLGAVYDMLHIGDFISEWAALAKFRGEYSPAEIFKFLVLSRILAPDSKRATSQGKDCFYGMEAGFTLPDVYRSLDVFTKFDVRMQRHLNEMVKATVGRDLTHAFYDVTNYFFEIDFPDGEADLRQRGVSKEHRVDPIVAMGLFMDDNGLPVSVSMFPGNTSESLTLQPVMADVKASYGLGRIIVVADKGLNSSGNIDKIVNGGNGFVFSQVLRGTKGKRYDGRIFDADGYTANADGTYKYKVFEEEYAGKDADGGKVTRKRKVLIYWDKADALMAGKKRAEKLEKAGRACKNNAYGIKKGVDEYTKEEIIDGDTGAFVDNVKKLRSVDVEKAEQDAKYDGYFCIITSELDYDEAMIRRTYGGLWRIEQSFRLLKSDLYARPVYVHKNEHIRAHFLICFVALLIMRIIQHKMGPRALSTERIARALRLATCRVLKGGIVHLDDVGGAIAFKKAKDKHGKLVDTLEFSGDDEIALDFKAIQQVFSSDIYNIYHRQEAFNNLLARFILA